MEPIFHNTLKYVTELLFCLVGLQLNLYQGANASVRKQVDMLF